MTANPSGPGRGELRPEDDVVSRRLEDEVVLVHLRTNRIYTLNETGARLWELLREGRSRAEIEEQLFQEFEVERDQLQEEVERLLSLLTREGLVSVGESS
jgi:hypothetical protein